MIKALVRVSLKFLHYVCVLYISGCFGFFVFVFDGSCCVIAFHLTNRGGRTGPSRIRGKKRLISEEVKSFSHSSWRKTTLISFEQQSFRAPPPPECYELSGGFANVEKSVMQRDWLFPCLLYFPSSGSLCWVMHSAETNPLQISL